MSKEDGEIELPMERFFVGYRKTSLPSNAVIVRIVVPLNKSRDVEVVRAYKQVGVSLGVNET